MPSADADKDEYFIKAVREGYRARSAYKLLQLARCFDLFEGVKRVVDLCAAPGSWSQVISNKLHGLSNFRFADNIELRPDVSIVAVDLDAMQNVPGVIQLKADITKLSTSEEIMRIFKGEKVDLIVSDGAHDVSGMEIVDFQLHLGLITACIHIFLHTLKEGGSFVTKIFDTWGCRVFIRQLRLFFREVHAVKPHSSRSESNECFAVCKGFKMPRGFEPSALTPYLVFSNRDFSKLTGIHKLYIPFLVTGMYSTKKCLLGKAKKKDAVEFTNNLLNVCQDVSEKVYREKSARLRKIYKLYNISKIKGVCAKVAKMKREITGPLIVKLNKKDMVDFYGELNEANREMSRQKNWKKFVKKMQADGKPLFYKKGQKESDPDPDEVKALIEKMKKINLPGSDNPWILPVAKFCKSKTPKCRECCKVQRKNNKPTRSSESRVLQDKILFKALNENEMSQLFTDEVDDSPYQDFTLKTRLDELHDEKWSLFTETNQITEKTVDYKSKFLVLEDPNFATVELVKERKEAFDELCQIVNHADFDAVE